MTISADFEIDRSEDILKHTAQIIIDQQRPLLPNLQSIKVIFPGEYVCNAFRHKLLAQLPGSYAGIIPPWCGTLKSYLSGLASDNRQDLKIISNETRRLLFIETLDTFPELYKDENKWQVTSSLLSLFDELYLANPDILNSTEEQWLATLKSAYKINDTIKYLRNEASLIQTLWIAWQEQLSANRLVDPVREYTKKLTSAKNSDSAVLYFVTTSNYSPSEITFIEKWKAGNHAFTIERANTESDKHSPIVDFINGTFDFDTPLLQRVSNIEIDRSKLNISFFPASDDESEACAVDLQIRKWLIAGKTNIGIVCENRKMSRRIRALLERAEVDLHDLSGWSLATTSAAAVLESWLQCVEEDFDHKALLDLLKSHFYNASSNEKEFHTQAVYRLEHDIILHENISSNITRYKNQLQYRANRLTHWPANTYDHIEQLLTELDDTSAPLFILFQSNQKHRLSKYINELLVSLERLGITDSFGNDDAGLMILQSLNAMQNGLLHSDPEMLWSDFRTWLGINMESNLFIPHVEASPVTLVNLKQSELMQFDGLIIASADKQHFPGTADNSPFFNQGVRQSLNLNDWRSKHAQRLDQFQQLLCSSEETLISYKAEDKGEAIPLSPWISALKNSYQLKHNDTLDNKDLLDELKTDTSVIRSDNIEPATRSIQAKIVIPENLVPLKFSARSHQSLINCPYKFFAEDALSLKPSEEISDELQKSDYGQLIHRILQTFHFDSNEKIKPFKQKLTRDNKQEATEYLINISTQLFKYDLENNALHKSWLHRWIKQIPSYIDWQISHQENWDISEVEKELSIELSNSTRLIGRIDRIDINNDEKLIIDYKTGRSAKQESVDSAEDVQLITYALLDDEVDNVFYLHLDDSKGGVRQAASLSGELLQTLKAACTTRLNDIIQMTHDGHIYTAWGDEKVCSYCHYDGVCRKPFWSKQ